ncbi:hypothetical protein AVMA1855_14190 [Acidovorax sp. SUPP1855]|uniref:hypothetical protein n=1 Tax=Acidovorax sp. SUPP1855 TaxID=431774 RepID=UPI0023DE696D|nr:hypothetical protein [Acidovorax sp. SUPP1855]GKS85312.1 hypothetical protein AVMA1855_14190 [Acidovorax sp. SUPP1855]
MLEGNRRLLALKLLLEPSLAEGSEISDGIKKLSEKHLKNVPKSLFCAVAPDRKTGLVWVRRKHGKGLDGAGTEDWGAVARDRFDAEMGYPTPYLDALDYVRTQGAVARDVADKIDSGKFAITTLGRILGDDTVREKLGIVLDDGKLKSDSDRKWLTSVLAEIVTAIATAKFEGEKFNVRAIDDQDGREAFAEKLLAKFPKPPKGSKPWVVDKSTPPPSAQAATRETKVRQAVSSKDRKTLIPKDFKLKLPQGKVNDVYHELKTLNIFSYINGASVLLRVFLEFGVDRYMRDFDVTLKAGVNETLLNKLKACVKYIEDNKLMTVKDLKGISTELANRHSFVSPETLNAYVHNPSFNADTDMLKQTWNRLQPFVAALWAPHP